MSQRVIRLNETDHHGHKVGVLHNGKSAALPYDDGVLLPEDATEFKMACLTCKVVLLEREDYDIEELPPWENPKAHLNLLS